MRLVKEIEYRYKIKNQKDIDKIKDIFRMLSIGFLKVDDVEVPKNDPSSEEFEEESDDFDQ